MLSRVQSSRARSGGVLVAVAVACCLPSTANAVDVNGSARLFTGTTTVDDNDTDIGEQQYQVSMSQHFGPWLNVQLFYRGRKDTTSTETQEFERRNSTPQIVVTYTRQFFSARLDYSDRRNRGTNPSANVDIAAAIGIFEFRPRKGPRYVVQLRDETNVADQQIFGRDTHSQLGSFEAVYVQGRFDGAASYSISELENNITGLVLDQKRALLRAAYGNDFLNNKLSFSSDVWLSRIEQIEEIPSGTFLAQPVPTVQGLAQVDTTPALGPLDPAPQLIDGDVTTPVSPPIDIGGANTFRNVGVDLGVTNRVTRLELTVNGVSGPSVLWDVYHSPDNDNWRSVLPIAVEWDPALLRYTVVIPETTDRYFKLVNVSPNLVATVLVTELRALLDVEGIGRSESDSTTYRLGATVGYRPTPRFRTNLALAASNERALFGGRVSQEVRNASVNAGLQWDVTRTMKANFAFLISQFEQELAPVLSRTETRYSAGLGWKPFPGLTGALDVLHQDESDLGDPIRTTNNLRGRLETRFYNDLELRSELQLSDVDDHAGGFTQQIIRWAETLRVSDRRRNWTLDGGTDGHLVRFGRGSSPCRGGSI